MTLFQHIKQEALLQNHSSFTYLLLHRLSISEALAIPKLKKAQVPADANKYQLLKNIEKNYKDFNFSNIQCEHISSIFSEIITIAELVQAEQLHQYESTTEGNLRIEFMRLAKNITKTEETYEELTASLRKQASQFTQKLLLSLTSPLLISQLELIIPTLEKCFPDIDRLSLENSIRIIHSNIELLKEIAAGDTVLISINEKGQIEDQVLSKEIHDGLHQNSLLRAQRKQISNDRLHSVQCSPS